MKIIFFIGIGLVAVLYVINWFFMPKWLYWITPRAYSAWDVLSEQYGRRTAIVIIIVVALLISGTFFILEYGSHHGW